jgi:hypothetical protein
MICAQARGPLACAPASRRAAIPVTRSLRARVLERAREQTQSDLDAEAARLEKVDAFEELKSMAAKQSVNRRQKVGRGCRRDQAAARPKISCPSRKALEAVGYSSLR